MMVDSNPFFLAEKCSQANTNWACCSEDHKCGFMQGDCDFNAECQEGLVCGNDNCGSGFAESYDCCHNSKQ